MADKANQNDASEQEQHDVAQPNETEQMSDEQQTIAELQEQLDAALAKAEENWDKAVRATAEQENIRRRAERDLENAHKFALEKFLQELIPIKDSLEMGLQAAQGPDADVAKLREGSELILKMLTDAMGKFGIEVVDPMGHPFDPEHHQAMTLLESPEHDPNTVVAVMQKGYKLNDRLVRPAMVAVSKAPTSDEHSGDENRSNNVDEKA
jgi:molecular chaperone GrpE